MKKYIFILLILTACGGQKMEEVASADTLEPLTDVPPTDLYSDGTSEQIKTANLRFQVTDLVKCREKIDASIRLHGAYIEESDLKYENPLLEEHFTIRVLSKSFEPLLKELEAQALYVNYRKVKSDDVDKEFVDLESRLKTKREMEQRYSEILRNSAKTTEDVLSTERQLGQLHEEIEVVVSRINFLKGQVKYSTIKLEVYQVDEQHAAIINNPTLLSQLNDSWNVGLKGITFLFFRIFRLWPLWITLALVWFVWRKRLKAFFANASPQ